MPLKFNPTTGKLDLTQPKGQTPNITDTKANILALTPTAGLLAKTTDTNELLYADGTGWTTSLGGIPNNIAVSRDIDGVIDEWTVDGTTYTPTYTTGLMTSYTDGTSTWTISRDGNNRITGVTK